MILSVALLGRGLPTDHAALFRDLPHTTWCAQESELWLHPKTHSFFTGSESRHEVAQDRTLANYSLVAVNNL